MKKKMKPGMFLARCYGIPVLQAYAHVEGNWFWNLTQFPGAYFDGDGVVMFQTEREYRSCLYLVIGPRNTWIRHKAVGIDISDIPGYQTLNPPPRFIE
jgi:hypothetical protein